MCSRRDLPIQGDTGKGARMCQGWRNALHCINIFAMVLVCGCSSLSLQPSSVPKSFRRTIPTTSEIVPTLRLITLQVVQSCLEELSHPQIFALDRPFPKWSDPENQDFQVYYTVFSTEAKEQPIDIHPIESFRTIALQNGQCQVLSQVQAEAIATQRLQGYYADYMALHQNRVSAVWPVIVNRWERDHYVSGPGDHPLWLDIEDIWIAKTLDLYLPDYMPIHIRSHP